LSLLSSLGYGSYQKSGGCSPIEDMAKPLIPVFQYETSFPQFLADINAKRAGTKGTMAKRHRERTKRGVFFETF
jgi:hypothetical protein